MTGTVTLITRDAHLGSRDLTELVQKFLLDETVRSFLVEQIPREGLWLVDSQGEKRVQTLKEIDETFLGVSRKK